jgi:predicted RND superfamily exporter protein
MESFFSVGHFIKYIEYIPMEPKKFGLLVAVLFFLISFLINLLQRRYSKTRLDRIFRKEESVVNALDEINKNLGKLEVNCTLEVHGTNSPQEVGKEIYVVRNKIQSTIDNIEEHLSSFRQYRRKEKAQGKKKKRPGKSHQTPP